MYITKYGTIWGQIPVTTGRVFWVAPSASYTVDGTAYIASNDNDGLSPERAKLTLASAISAATADVSDVIVLLPGAHSWSAQVDVSKAGLTITGLPGGKGHPQKMRTSVTISAADEILGVTAADVEIAYLHFIAVTAQAAIEASGAADNLYIHNCTGDMFTAAVSTSTMFFQSIATSGGLKNLVIEDCYVESLDAQGPYLDLNDVSYGVVRRSVFRHTGATALADAFVSATGAVDILFDDVALLCGTGAAITDSFDWTGNTTDGSLQLRNVYMSLGAGVPNGSADADIWVSSNSEISQTAAGGSAPVNVLNAG
jgi:hypothetical protein